MADEGTAAIQDSSGAILLRLGDDVGGLELELGELVEVAGTRSTKSGMETIRLSQPPRRLGQPGPARCASAAPPARLGEEDEAVLVVVRGEVTTSPRRTTAQNIYFDVDDGSGPIRIFLSPRSGATAEGIVIGSWVERARRARPGDDRAAADAWVPDLAAPRRRPRGRGHRTRDGWRRWWRTHRWWNV